MVPNDIIFHKFSIVSEDNYHREINLKFCKVISNELCKD